MSDPTQGGNEFPDTGEFEAGMARHPFRAPPVEWRTAILADAGARLMESGTSAVKAEGRIPAWGGGGSAPWWERLRSGWSMAAAAWALILGLNQLSVRDAGGGQVRRPPFSPAAMAIVAEQQRAALGAMAGLSLPEGEARPPVDRPGTSRGEPRADGERSRRHGSREREGVRETRMG